MMMSITNKFVRFVVIKEEVSGEIPAGESAWQWSRRRFWKSRSKEVEENEREGEGSVGQGTGDIQAKVKLWRLKRFSKSRMKL